MNNSIKISEEVKYAIEHNKPVVALESTIISHGMPYPQNKETAIKAEKLLREKGVVPATIAIINGIPTIGISQQEIDYLGQKGLSVTKASRRDIPVLMALKKDGATTVAATMLLAHIAGIQIFATGGIGGVHRNGQNTMDISADLDELQNTNVNVVCAGAKSILDLNLTMEYLETKGVPVIGYNTDYLPAFYTRKSNIKVNYNIENPTDIAQIIKCKKVLGYHNGMVIANPVPMKYSMDENYINSIIEDALCDAEKLHIQGKEITPFLLDKIQKLTHGSSLESNIELVYNNIELAANIAIELCKLS